MSLAHSFSLALCVLFPFLSRVSSTRLARLMKLVGLVSLMRLMRLMGLSRLMGLMRGGGPMR